MKSQISNVKCQNLKGFTFVDVLIGISLMLIVFLGIFGAYQLGLKVIGLSRQKIIATSLANQKLEEARNLPYQKVGIEGIDENGALKETEYYPSENPKYTIFTDVDCRNDPADGSDDTCLCDYKTVTVTVSWSGLFGGEVSLATDIAPKNEIQECEKQGGVLEVSVFDAKGQPVADAQVKVEDSITGYTESCLTDQNGECSGQRGIFLDPSENPENYKVTVSKTGYNTDQTFATGDTYDSKTIANPEKPNITILSGQITQSSFSIDLLSSFSIETRSSRGKTSFNDSFDNMSKISEFSNILVSEGKVSLAKTNGDYISSGFLISTDITSPNLQGWDEFTFIKELPTDTEIKIQLLYFDGEDWVLIPDSDLPQNSTGLGPSPIDLSILDHTTYDTLRAKATLSTTNPSQTPLLYEWSISYFTKVSQPVSDVTFLLRGNKIVGTDSQEEPIYKYPATSQTIDKTGTISDLEWDTYNFSNFAISGESVELEEGVPGTILPDGSLSVDLAPNTTQSVTLYLAAENTLLVSVFDSETKDPILGANVRVANNELGYDKTQQTDESGETFFIPLEEANYDLEVTAEGYEAYTDRVSVIGDVTKTINLILSPS